MLPRTELAHTRKPRRAQWTRERNRARREICEVCLRPTAFPDLNEWGEPITRNEAKVDHIVSERLIRLMKLGKPHTPQNLISLCQECHSKKTAIEWMLDSGNLLGFVSELKRLGWNLCRVKIAVLAYLKTDIGRLL